MLVFGLGLAINVAPLTATAMDSAPAEHAGVASAINNDVARAAGLIAVLPALSGITGQTYLHPAALASGFRTAVLISAGFCVLGGVLAGLTIRNPDRHCTPAQQLGREFHCAVSPPAAVRRRDRHLRADLPRGSCLPETAARSSASTSSSGRSGA